jgi:hypothetical protein
MLRRRSEKPSPFNLLPSVGDAIHALAKDDQERTGQLILQFNSRMAADLQLLEKTAGLDMTEEEQLGRITEPEEAIRQKGN